MSKLLLIFIYLIGLTYLLLPARPLPELDNAVLSNEEGDTWQNPDQRGYYTNLTRDEVLNQIQNKSKIYFFGFVIPSYRLNYRPEEAQTLVRDQLKSNYLEEIIYPLHSSIFVNGWEPKLAPRRGGSETSDLNLAIYGVPYEAKITLRPNNSSVWSRIVIWSAIFPLSYLVLLSFRKSVAKYDQD